MGAYEIFHILRGCGINKDKAGCSENGSKDLSSAYLIYLWVIDPNRKAAVINKQLVSSKIYPAHWKIEAFDGSVCNIRRTGYNRNRLNRSLYTLAIARLMLPWYTCGLSFEDEQRSYPAMDVWLNLQICVREIESPQLPCRQAQAVYQSTAPAETSIVIGYGASGHIHTVSIDRFILAPQPQHLSCFPHQYPPHFTLLHFYRSVIKFRKYL